MPNERALAAGPGISFTDSGANSIFAISASLIAGPNITINQVGNSLAISGSAAGGAAGENSASYVVLSLTSSLANERVLSGGPGIVITDYGAGNVVRVSASFVAGDNITITTQSNGTIAISASVGGGGGNGDPNVSFIVVSHTGSLNSERALAAGPGIGFVDGGPNSFFTISSSLPTNLPIATWTVGSASSVSPLIGGQAYFVPAEHKSTDIRLRVILSVTTGSNTAHFKLYNVTSGTYVHIGGPGITGLSSSNTTPTLLSSSNLVTAINFNLLTSSIYEAQLYSATSSLDVSMGGATIITF